SRMYMLAPDIVAEARGLPNAISGTGLALVLMLWALGWWGHRCWIVRAATIAAGVFALAGGPLSNVQPLVVAVLLALAVGVLALSLVRLVVFAAGGLVAWMAVHAALPSFQEPLICFLAGGIVGILLFRSCTMALTSFARPLLMGSSALCLADRVGKLTAAEWSARHAVLLNWACAGVAVLGWLVQFLLARWRHRREQQRREEYQKAREKERRWRRRPWWVKM